MANENVISAVGYFDGSNSKGNFDVQLKAKFMNNELPNALQFVAGIGKRLRLVALIEDKRVRLGTFTVYSIRIDNAGNCFITFKSNKDSVKIEDFSKLMVDEAFIAFKAMIIDDEE